MKITLVRQIARQFTDHERRIAMYVLLNGIDGLTEDDRKAWRRFLGLTLRLDAGEMSTVEVRCERVPKFHRRHMKLESMVFAAQEQFDNFERGFRDWLKVNAGFCEWHSREGALVAVPRSTAYEEVEEVEFRAFHDAVVQFLKTERAAKKLWPHLSERGAMEMITGLLGQMDE